ncbi:MAG: fluoride efflux transporter CrcB [Phascolarctobacterium sp.]|nr:fluoride efflux transporter CrcB [Phascolarctobacterium sp.]
MNLVIIALGGALGAVSRFLMGNAVSKAVGSALPYGTFVINLVGCFAMGLLMTIIVDRELLSAAWRLFLCVGFLGGFTTFSSFGYEALMLLTEGRLLAALTYVSGSVVLGLAAAAAGVLCARAL